MKNSYKIGSIKQFIDITGLDEESEVTRKQYNSEMVVLPDEERTIIAKISSTTTDADGDVVDPEGCDFSRFMKNPVIHRNHSYKVEDVVGKATEVSADKKGIFAKIKFADTPMALDCWKLVQGGYVRANSIGFIAKEAVIKGTKEFVDYCNKKMLGVSEDCKRIITKFELIENSIVSVPCNPDALIQAISAKSIELSDKTIKELDLPKKEEHPEEVFKHAILDLIEKPYPNFHAFRINSPDKYTSFNYKKNAFGEGIDVVYGVKEGTTEVQALRFDAKKWSFEDAKKWVKDHDYNPISEEPASKPDKSLEIKEEPKKEEPKVETPKPPVVVEEPEVFEVLRVGGPKVDKGLVEARKKGQII